MKIDIWSDIACPFCYIGITQLKSAIDKFDHKAELELVYHSFELDPTAPERADETMSQMLVRKKGLSIGQVVGLLENITTSAKRTGLEFDLNSAKIVNTFNGHRLAHLASEQGKAGQMMDRLYKAYFTEGLSVADIPTLVKLSVEVGLDEELVRAALESDKYSDAVKADIRMASQRGIRGVPLFVIDGKHEIFGAQGQDAMLKALTQAWQDKSS